MGLPDIDLSYEPFSMEKEDIELNRAFVAGLRPDVPCRLVGLACGTGTLTSIVMESFEAGGPLRHGDLFVVGIDISRTSLEILRRTMERACSEGVIRVIEGPGDSIPLEEGWADAVLIGN